MWTPEQVREWDQQYLMPTYRRQPPLFVRGEGAYLYDSDGKAYLDFVAGIAVCSLGHSHPRLVEAIRRQSEQLLHVSNLYLTAPQAVLAKRLCELTGMERVFFCNSGTEACEAAIKIVRKFARHQKGIEQGEILCLEGSFHGRTMGALSATFQTPYQEPFQPLLPGFKSVPRNDVKALQQAFNERTVALFVEPIQGESGIHRVNPLFLQEARVLCDRYGALLVIDEVQTGMGRTGKWFAWQHVGVQPDLMLLAKGLGGGVPIGACLARGAAATTFQPGDHGSTFAANPLATTAALTVIEVIEQEQLIQNAAQLGHSLHETFRQMQAENYPIAEVRGLGLMNGLALTLPIAKQVATEALRRGLLVNPIGEDVLRLVPPLIITQKEVDQAIRILRECLHPTT